MQAAVAWGHPVWSPACLPRGPPGHMSSACSPDPGPPHADPSEAQTTLYLADLLAGPWRPLASAVRGHWQPLCLRAPGAVPSLAQLSHPVLTWTVIYVVAAKGHVTWGLRTGVGTAWRHQG